MIASFLPAKKPSNNFIPKIFYLFLYFLDHDLPPNFLFFYLVTLLYGSISSLNYTLETNQRLFTAWAPYVWPIKSIMTFGILLMLLQTLSMFFKDLYRIKGKRI